MDALVKGWKLTNWCLYFVYSCILQDFNFIVDVQNIWCTFQKLSLQYLIIIIQIISIEIWNPAKLLKALWWGGKTRKKPGEEETTQWINATDVLTNWLSGPVKWGHNFYETVFNFNKCFFLNFSSWLQFFKKNPIHIRS